MIEQHSEAVLLNLTSCKQSRTDIKWNIGKEFHKLKFIDYTDHRENQDSPNWVQHVMQNNQKYVQDDGQKISVSELAHYHWQKQDEHNSAADRLRRLQTSKILKDYEHFKIVSNSKPYSSKEWKVNAGNPRQLERGQPLGTQHNIHQRPSRNPPKQLGKQE